MSPLSESGHLLNLFVMLFVQCFYVNCRMDSVHTFPTGTIKCIVLYHITSQRVVPYRTVRYRTILCRIVSYGINSFSKAIIQWFLENQTCCHNVQ